MNQTVIPKQPEKPGVWQSGSQEFAHEERDPCLRQFPNKSCATTLQTNSYQQRFVKRTFDILFSLISLFAGLPLFFLIALIVKLTSKGPIFYRSQRIGKNAKLFTFWKFRTMYTNADLKLKKLLDENPLLRKEWQKYFKLKKDPRLTKIGKFLRKYSLDEFPQFWNVLVGDLSIVGPRPYLPNETAEIRRVIRNQIDHLFSVRPGLTGLWQTSGRNCLTFHQRVLLDMQYVHSQSFFFDLKLIAKTIPLLIFSKGAY